MTRIYFSGELAAGSEIRLARPQAHHIAHVLRMKAGAAKYLFTPLAMAVVFAMMTSYLLTRTIVPTLVHYLLPPEMALYQEEEGGQANRSAGIIWRIHQSFERRFERLRHAYRELLTWVLSHRLLGGGAFGAFVLLSLGLLDRKSVV